MQSKKELNEYLNDTLVNKLIESNVPPSCRSTPCILGIDEAGRGPVLGPMVYAIAYYPKKNDEVLAKMKFADSKQLTETVREKLFESLQTKEEGFQDIGYFIKVISPNMISNVMLRRKKYNLNALSHDTAINLIRSIESKGIPIDHVYIDTVGPAIQYKEKLQKFFPKYSFTVAEKADSKYPIVSAASVCAKVMRDRIVRNWKYAESEDLHLEAFDVGSGYPADPETKKFLENSLDPVFGYPTFARFSWSTITKILDKSGCKCDWNEPSDEAENPKALQKQQDFFRNCMTKVPSKSKVNDQSSVRNNPKRTNADVFFGDRLLSKVSNWAF